MFRSRKANEQGIALIVTLMAMTLISTIGAGLVLMASTDAMIARNFQSAAAARYAAASIAEFARADLVGVADWDQVLTGAVRSAFADGPPSGSRSMAGGATVDLSQVMNLARCGRATPCSDTAMNVATARRPWGTNNARWQPFAYGSFQALTGQPSGRAATIYVVALVGDDGLETDGDPLRDGGGADNPGLGVLAIRAEAFSAGGAHAATEATVARDAASGAVNVVAWRSL